MNTYSLSAILLLIVSVSCSTPKIEINKEISRNITWQKLDTKTDASFRGLSVVSERIFWISGSKGTVIRTLDGGKSFEDVSVPSASDLDFRDVHAFDANTAIVMNAGSPGVFFRTSNGGKNWTRVYNDQRQEIFFDAMDFWDDQRGVAFGDPIDGRLVIVLTEDGGKSWKELDQNLQPKLDKGEAGFAASGSCLAAVGKESILIGTGGHLEGQSHPTSRLLISHDRGKSWISQQLPIQRNQSSGIFSVCMPQENHIIAVGGNYTQPDGTSQNCAISLNKGESWKLIKKSTPSGFRSAVTSTMMLNKLFLVTAGTNGIDISIDQGLTWKRVSDISTNAIAFSPEGNLVVTAGPNGSSYLGNFAP